MNVYLKVASLRPHGIEMAVALVFDCDSGRPVTSVVRWSETQARRDAYAWAATRGIRISESAPTRQQPGVAPAALFPEVRHG